MILEYKKKNKGAMRWKKKYVLNRKKAIFFYSPCLPYVNAGIYMQNTIYLWIRNCFTIKLTHFKVTNNNFFDDKRFAAIPRGKKCEGGESKKKKKLCERLQCVCPSSGWNDQNDSELAFRLCLPPSLIRFPSFFL